MSRTKLATFSKIALALLWLTLFTLTHMPVPPQLPLENISDKLEHATAFAALAFMLATTWELAVGRLNGRHLVMVWIGIAIYGAVDELTQIPVGRDCEFNDWVADLSGAAIGIMAFLVARAVITRFFRTDNAESE